MARGERWHVGNGNGKCRNLAATSLTPTPTASLFACFCSSSAPGRRRGRGRGPGYDCLHTALDGIHILLFGIWQFGHFLLALSADEGAELKGYDSSLRDELERSCRWIPKWSGRTGESVWCWCHKRKTSVNNMKFKPSIRCMPKHKNRPRQRSKNGKRRLRSRRRCHWQRQSNECTSRTSEGLLRRLMPTLMNLLWQKIYRFFFLSIRMGARQKN